MDGKTLYERVIFPHQVFEANTTTRAYPILFQHTPDMPATINLVWYVYQGDKLLLQGPDNPATF